MVYAPDLSLLHSMKNHLGYALHLINALSIDVVLGSVLSSYFVSTLLAANMPLAWWALLSAAVWVIYTLDHLLDAMMGQRNLAMLRHQLHRRYWVVLSGSSGLLAFVSLSSAYSFLPREIFIFGLLLGMLVIVYLLAVHTRISTSLGSLRMKELTVAILYTVGIWGGPLMLRNQTIGPQILLALSCFFCSALGNLILLSLYEIEADKQSNMTSFYTIQRRGAVEFSLWILLASLILLAALLAVLATNAYLFWYGIATLFVALLFLDLSRRHLLGRPIQHYRTVVDSVFIVVPMCILLFV